MKKSLTLLSLLCASLMVVAPTVSMAQTASTSASTTAPAKKVVKKKVVKKKVVKKAAVPATAAAAAAVSTDEDDITPDIKTSTAVAYQCAVGSNLTIYRNAEDPQYIALKWGNVIRRMKEIPTTTGASRYENKKYGFVWIGIPSKGMLLDSKGGHELANDCTSVEQHAAAPVANATPAA
ncbi:hypothetical protein [Glaciimonas soli]|uniref:C-type lysozyme inhibitor domain-containing protein n=1 Tax=Glaciimonas soli TaxID=2590999 RepID=A0A843YNX1_9BURK|nr:hypothetical protein [Glaciimonas soli]MQQ99080.1 hypothetical protein [Glaciimonas soli]